MRTPRPLSLSASESVCLLLAYTLVISICAPFALKRVEAAPASTEAGKKAHARAAAEKRPAARREDELIVRFRRGTTEQERTALVEAKDARRVRRLRGQATTEKLRLRRGQDLEAVAAELRQSPGVELVEFNYLVEGAELLPNDARFSEQWALKNTGQGGGQAGSDVNAPAAWETTTGAPSTVIAVIDSGVDFTHPDLQNNRWANTAEQLNGEDDDHNGLVDDLSGWDFVAGDNDAQDEHGHGTMMAGIIAAEGNNWAGTTGVMWRASLMSLRVLSNTGTGDVAAAVEAIDYAVDEGAQVINCSWGTEGESTLLREAIERAGQRGVVVVTSSGNGSRDIGSEPFYPTSYNLPNVIAVASTDSSDQLTSWSNYGSTQVTVAAPGIDILTTEMGVGYRAATGSSVSAALVTGVVGLVRTVSPWLGPAETKAAVVSGAHQVPSLAGKVSSGGVVSARGALDSLPEPGATPTPSPGGGQTPGEPSPEGLPDLDAYRDIEPVEPVAPTQIAANTLPVCDADCGGSIPPPGTNNPDDVDLSRKRTDPLNATGGPGVNLLSRNFNWGVPVVSLPGRSGLDLGLSLVHNSLVWVKQLGAIRFNADRGFPGAGFRLGFPVIQQRYLNADTGQYAYMMVTPSGSRVELRQVGTSTAYESPDGSYIRMVDNGAAGATVLTPDGTKMTYGPFVNNEMHCTKVTDRNGNYLTVAYNTLGRPTSVVDTLNRTVTFVYDANGYLTSIRQTWNGVTHTWATFSYGTLVIQTNFSNLVVEGPANGSSIPVLTQVGLDDGSRYNFEYTSWGQVWKISHSAADGHLLSYTSLNLPLTNANAATDCPRPTQQRDWAEDWNGDVDGVPAAAEEALTQYSTAANGSSGQVTFPDNTIYKELYATAGWQRGLVTGTENWSGGVKRKWTTTSWTQDDEALAYRLNPRPDETNVYDEAGNRRRTVISYASYSLPSDVLEYDKDGTTLLRQTHADYNLTTTYVNNATNRRIIGLVTRHQVKDGAGNLASQVEYQYDEGGTYFDTTDAPARHDTANYGTTFIAGRGNLTSIRRFSVPALTPVSEWNIGYNVAGSPVLRRDPLSHYTYIDYTDSFSDATKNALGTYAYPTKVTDPGGFYSTAQYHYDFGAVTKTSVPSSGTTTVTYLDHQMTYDTAGRLTKVLNLDNSSYTRWVYQPSHTFIQQYQTVLTATTAGEVYSATVLDGAGRTTAASTEHTFGTPPTYSGRLFAYDKMGRLVKQSNPTEFVSNATAGTWDPAGDDAAAGWKYVQQTYDWKGRPLKTTNTDGTFSEMEYGGCACAGGEVTTFKGVQVTEGRRQQKTYKDTLGRVVKTEVLNWNGTVYSTVKNTYNVRDQVTLVREYAGADTSPTFQDTALTYDGHGRLASSKRPEQTAATTYLYNADDTVQKATDGRGAYSTFTYNSRHLVASIAYTPPAGITDTPTVTYAYDAAGHRTSMSGGASNVTYQYDSLSRLTSETRTFTGLAGSYALSYAYNLAGGLTSVTDPTGTVINYTLDQAGRTTSVTGTAFGGVTQYATNIKYRAWGNIKSLTYGNTRSLSVSYNTRLQPTHYEVPGVMSKDYEYEADGSLGYSRDLLDGRFDRSYARDHVGRVAEAFSGPLARGLADTDDRPYKQYYQYDAMGHLTGRVGSELWNNPGTMFSETHSYVNNRNTAWQYDADGRLKDGDGIHYTYDAAGSAVTVVNGDHTQAQSFDGDGTRVKIVDEQYVDDGSGTTSTDTEIRYYVTSSVLGAVLTELDETGQKVRGFVYGGGKVLAWQIKDGGTESVRWEHRDLSGASFRTTATSSGLDYSRTAELDPLGSDAGVRSPFTLAGPPRPPEERQDLTYPGFAALMNTDCKLNGIDVPCGELNRLMEAGATGIDTWIRDEEIRDAAGIRPGPQIPIEPRGVGLFTFWVSDEGTQRHDGDRDDVMVINKNEDFLGHWETINIGDAQTDVVRRFALDMDCVRNATEQMRRVQSDFSKYANFLGTFGPLGGEEFEAALSFAPGPISQGQNLAITQNIVSSPVVTGFPGIVIPAVTVTQNTSVKVMDVSDRFFKFSTAKDHPLDGTISFSAMDMGRGRIKFSVNIYADFKGPGSEFAFSFLGGGYLEKKIWHNLLNNIKKDCAK